MNRIGEGIHKVVAEKSPGRIVEMDRMMPSDTINRGQNSDVIFQTNWDVWEGGSVIEMGTFNGRCGVK
jgi:hypothetical protein